MIITKRTAQKAIKAGTARMVGTCIHDGWRWAIIDRLDIQRVDHYKIGSV